MICDPFCHLPKLVKCKRNKNRYKYVLHRMARSTWCRFVSERGKIRRFRLEIDSWCVRDGIFDGSADRYSEYEDARKHLNALPQLLFLSLPHLPLCPKVLPY